MMDTLSQYLDSVIEQRFGRLPCHLVQDVLKYGGLVLLRSSHAVSPDEQLDLGLPTVLTLLQLPKILIQLLVVLTLLKLLY
jgi:hypothetical protein